MEGKIENYFVPLADIVAGVAGVFPQPRELKWVCGPTFVLRLGCFTIVTEPLLGVKKNKACYIRVKTTSDLKEIPVERFYDPEPFANTNFDLFLTTTNIIDMDLKASKILDKRIKTVATQAGISDLKNVGFTNIVILNWGEKIIFEKEHQHLTIVAVNEITGLTFSDRQSRTYLIEYAIKNKLFRIYWNGNTILFRWT